MTKFGAEKRRFKRVFFSKRDGIVAEIKLPEEDQQIKAQVLNLSEGGIFITTDPNNQQFKNFIEGDSLTLTEISGTNPSMNIEEIEMQVRWLLQDKFLAHIGLGCEFIHMTESTRNQLAELVAGSEP